MTNDEEPSLAARRVILRRPRKEDIPAWTAILLDPELCRYTGGEVQSPVMAWSRVLAAAGSWDMMGFGPFSIVERASNRWAGCIGPWCPPDWPGKEFGWRLARWAHGKGYATEAGQLAIDWVFETLRWDRMIHCIHPENLASIRLAERLGSSLVGPVKVPGPMENDSLSCWSQSVGEWRARQVNLR